MMTPVHDCEILYVGANFPAPNALSGQENGALETRYPILPLLMPVLTKSKSMPV